MYSKKDQLGKSKPKQTQINRAQRSKIADYCQKHNLISCQLNVYRCMGQAHDPAHRHERTWYKGKDPDLLSNPTQWLPSCRNCHNYIDKMISKEEREEIFKSRMKLSSIKRRLDEQ